MNKKTKTYQKIKPLASLILNGKVLCIDPSIGSAASRPGYAWYENGELVESGEIVNRLSDNKSKRLFEIAETIRTDFPVPDVLVVEYIPNNVYKRSKMNSIGIASLQRAIGAILGARPFEHLLEIPTVSWMHYRPDDYKKTDEWDAIVMGICVVSVARQIIEDNNE